MPSNLFKITSIDYRLYNAWINAQRNPCDQGTPGARFVDSIRVKPETPGAVKVKRKSTKWYGRLPGGRVVPLSANKVAAQQIFAALVRKSELGRAGISDPFEDQRKRPLSEHVDEWEASLRAGGASAKHVKQTVACVRNIFEECRFVFLADLSASRVQQYLADLRGQRRPVPEITSIKQSYTKAELAALTGLNLTALAPLMRRHRLEATGEGKARRYPRATLDALRSLRTQGRSIKTMNLYLAAVKQFAAWLVQDRRTLDNPLAHLSGGNVKLDRRHDRRAMTTDELCSVIRAAQQSERVYRELTGRDRAMLYTIACTTGFRASELASLTPGSFDLDNDPPIVTLAALRAKNGTCAVQPLPPDVIEDLRRYLTSRPAGLPVWPGTWPKKAAEMFTIDLDAAAIPYVIDGPNGPLYADFHSLRHSFIAMLDQSGATLKEAMQLARHSDPRLTMAVYGRAHLHDLGKAVGRLPSVMKSATALDDRAGVVKCHRG